MGGNYYAGTSLSQQRRLAPRLRYPGMVAKRIHRWRKAQSPASGTDHLGPTAVIGSVGKLPYRSYLPGGVPLNQKTEPNDAENESDKQKPMVLLRTFF